MKIYLNTKSIASTHMVGVISLKLPQKALRSTWLIMPIRMPSLMLKLKGITTIVMLAVDRQVTELRLEQL